jgi:uncharacterized protein
MTGIPAPLALDTPMPTPTRPAARLLNLDVLRGGAIFGILVVNVLTFSTPAQWWDLSALPWSQQTDRLAFHFIEVLFSSKFYTLFSLLFGVGLTLQIERATAGETRATPLLLRRMTGLLAIGLLHALLLWYGDVLTTYALLGFALLLLYRLPSTLLLTLAVFSYAVAPALFVADTIPYMRSFQDPEFAAEVGQWVLDRDAELHAAAAETIANYTSPDFTAVFDERLADHRRTLSGVFTFFGPNILAMFLVGVVVGRSRVFARIDEFRVPLAVLVCAGLPLGLALRIFAEWLTASFTWLDGGAHLIMAYLCEVASTPLIAFGYASAILLLVRYVRFARTVFTPLAAVGRTALTNYLLQSLVCTTIFYGYGLGYYGQVGPARLILLAGVIFAAQIPLSVLWLNYFQFGPTEWLWRSFTYLRFQPLLRRRRPGLPPPTRGAIT